MLNSSPVLLYSPTLLDFPAPATDSGQWSVSGQRAAALSNRLHTCRSNREVHASLSSPNQPISSPSHPIWDLLKLSRNPPFFPTSTALLDLPTFHLLLVRHPDQSALLFLFSPLSIPHLSQSYALYSSPGSIPSNAACILNCDLCSFASLSVSFNRVHAPLPP